MNKFFLVFCLFLITTFSAQAQDYWGEEGGLDDGTYDATVTTPSGTYTVPVEVDDGEVSHVHWPNGGDMNVYGTDIDDGEASGYNSRGDYIDIEIDD